MTKALSFPYRQEHMCYFCGLELFFFFFSKTELLPSSLGHVFLWKTPACYRKGNFRYCLRCTYLSLFQKRITTRTYLFIKKNVLRLSAWHSLPFLVVQCSLRHCLVNDTLSLFSCLYFRNVFWFHCAILTCFCNLGDLRLRLPLLIWREFVHNLLSDVS